MEVKRQYDVLDRHLATRQYMAGDDYSIADMAIWPWYGAAMLGQVYEGAAQFLSLSDYSNVRRWVDQIAARPAVQRGRRVNRKPTEANPEFIPERHSRSDFDQTLVLASPLQPALNQTNK
jgi:GST-like protein